MSHEVVLKALSNVIDPDFKKDLVSLNMIRDLKVEGQKISFTLFLTTPACPLKEQLKSNCLSEIEKALPGSIVDIKLDAQVHSHKEAPAFKNIKNIIAVVSGKGGVGKSTISVNLAVGLARSGAKVGLVDADIHGPSMPIMFGVENQYPEVRKEDGKDLIMPIEKYGVKMMSIGFFVDPQKALIWRGAMTSSALQQIMNDTQWGDLDYLIIDTPPGTGDIHLTLVQNYSVTGVVVVTTPQNVALADARKAMNMFANDGINVPILGVVENMSYFTPADAADKRYYIFGKDGAQKLVDEFSTSILGQIPIEEEVCQGGEKGEPIVLNGEGNSAKAFFSMAQNVARATVIRNISMEPTPIVQINH